MLAVAAALPVAIALSAFLWWLDVSDAAKAASPHTAWLTSGQLSEWNHGTHEQRLSAAFWVDTIAGRSALDILGYAAWWLPLVFAASWFAGERRGMAKFYAVSMASFLLPMLVFTNLHMVHNYYQVANAVFLVVFCAAAIDHACRNRAPWVAAAVTVLFVIGMFGHTWRHFMPSVLQDKSTHPSIELARAIRTHVHEDDIIITAGLNWAATVPYYSKRRALMLIRESDLQNVPRVFPTREDPNGARVGALVQCLAGHEFVMRLEPMLGPEPQRINAGDCVILVRKPSQE
jgi:hypothetical protein